LRVGGKGRPLVPGVAIVAVLAAAGCTAPVPRVSLEPQPAAKPVAFAPTTASLIGANPVMLERWLGAPGLIRRDDPAQVWQYRDKSCVLDVYLYPDESGMRVAHAEARSKAVAGDPLAPCLTALSSARHKAVGS